MAKYVGKRIVPIHRGVWDQSQPYEMLSIVLEEASGDSYISKRAVPAGTAITDETFWALHSKFSQQIKDMSDQLTETEQRIRTDNDETEAAVKRDNAATKQTLEERVVAAETAMTNQKNNFDQTASALNTRMNEVLAAGTGDGQTEIADARVDANGETHASLGDAIRSIIPKLRDETTEQFAALPFMAKVHDGYYVNWHSGRLEKSAGACYTDKVACKPGDVFHVLSNGYMNGCAALLFHNDTIVGHYGDDAYEHGGVAIEYDITIPDGVNWIQFGTVNKNRGFSVAKEDAETIGVLGKMSDELSETRFTVDEHEFRLDDMVVYSVNLFNKDDERNLSNQYWGTNGSVIDLDRSGMSHPIAVKKDVSYKWYVRWSFWGDNCRIGFITDREGNFISRFNAAGDNGNNYVTYTPEKDCYIRIKLYLPDAGVTMFCREDMWPDEYVPYSISMKYADLTDYVKKADYDILAERVQTNETETEKAIEDLFLRSVNLFNMEDPRNLANQYWETNGTVTNLDRAGISHPIRIEKGVTYKWTAVYNFWGGNHVYNNITDEEGNHLKSCRATMSEDRKYLTYTATEDGYIRIKVYVPSLSSIMFCREDDWPEEYVPFYIRMKYADLTDYVKNTDLAHLATKEDVVEYLPNILYGKTAVFDGDSIGQGSGTDGNWARVIGEANHMDWHNHSVGGGTITAEVYVASTGGARHWVSRYIDTIHERYPEVDYLILEGGTNDADLLRSEIETKMGELNIGDFSGNYDDTTFTGALDSLFFKATSYYPAAKIGYIVAQKMGAGGTNYGPDNNRRKFFLRAIEVCKKWGIPYIDLWDESPLNPKLKCYYDSTLDSAGNRDAGKAYTDGQHLTAVGYGIVSSKIEAWMRTL